MNVSRFILLGANALLINVNIDTIAMASDYRGGNTVIPVSTPNQLISVGQSRIDGRLIRTEHGCLLIQTLSGRRLLILWPPETYLGRGPGHVVVYRSRSAISESKIGLLGLIVKTKHIDIYNGEKIPKECNVGSVILVGEDGFEVKDN